MVDKRQPYFAAIAAAALLLVAAYFLLGIGRPLPEPQVSAPDTIQGPEELVEYLPLTETQVIATDVLADTLEECEAEHPPEENFHKDLCYKAVALEKENDSICTRIEDSYFKDKCYLDIGIELRSESSCNKIQDAEIREACIDTLDPNLGGDKMTVLERAFRES